MTGIDHIIRAYCELREISCLPAVAQRDIWADDASYRRDLEMILAQHRGIRSLGIIMATGITTCMVVALTLMPAILNFLNERGWTIQKTQRDNARSTLGREEPR